MITWNGRDIFYPVCYSLITLLVVVVVLGKIFSLRPEPTVTSCVEAETGLNYPCKFVPWEGRA